MDEMLCEPFIKVVGKEFWAGGTACVECSEVREVYLFNKYVLTTCL